MNLTILNLCNETILNQRSQPRVGTKAVESLENMFCKQKGKFLWVLCNLLPSIYSEIFFGHFLIQLFSTPCHLYDWCFYGL